VRKEQELLSAYLRIEKNLLTNEPTNMVSRSYNSRDFVHEWSKFGSSENMRHAVKLNVVTKAIPYHHKPPPSHVRIRKRIQ
jgi:hypothetical protein